MTSEHTRRTARGSAPDVSRWSKRLGAIDGERTFSLRERLHTAHLQRVRIDEHRNTTSASQLPTKTVKNAETDRYCYKIAPTKQTDVKYKCSKYGSLRN